MAKAKDNPTNCTPTSKSDPVKEMNELYNTNGGGDKAGCDGKVGGVKSSKSGKKTVEVNGKKVIVDDNTFDPNLIDKQGRTNIQRMEQGLAPIGTDGKSVNIHHMDQTDDGTVMEIIATEHQQRYNELHTNIGQSPSLIDRKKFNKWRKGYWKWRSNDIKNGGKK